MAHFVYIVSSTRHYFKVGVARNPEQRLASLQTGNPEALHIEALIKCPSEKAAYGLESVLHRRFVRRHMRNEWFKFSKTKSRIKKEREKVYNTILTVVQNPIYSKFVITKWPYHEINDDIIKEDVELDESVRLLIEQENLYLSHMREILLA
jgi:hypothetical protein